MSHLRFTPAEYNAIAHFCREHHLGGRNQPAFRRLLVESLRGADPELARRVARLGRGKLNLLYWHFRDPVPSVNPRPNFTAQELRLVSEACIAAPFPVRLVRPFKHLLVELFQEDWPELARKLSSLGGHQFERLYEKASERKQKEA